MSSDELEITTPAAKRAPAKRPIAGPSHPAARKRRAPARDSSSSSVEEIAPIAAPAPASPAAAPAPAANGRAAKGKARAPAARPKKPPAPAPDDADAGADALDAPAGKGKSSANSEDAAREVARMRVQMQRMEDTRTALAAQLEELLRVRTTEAEDLLERQREQYEARLATQERMIQELTGQVERVQPLSRAGPTNVLHLVTQQAAEDARHNVEVQLAKWKRAAEEKEARLAELEETVRITRLELEQEKKRSRELAAAAPRPTPGARKPALAGVPAADDPKMSRVISFYEDLTNILVTNFRFQTGRFLDLQEYVYTCVYTYKEDSADTEGTKSLSFTLHFRHDPLEGAAEPITSLDQLVPSVHYVPLYLDQEPPEFVAALDYMNGPFTFEQMQLSLFLKSLKDVVGQVMAGDAAEADVEVEEIQNDEPS